MKRPSWEHYALALAQAATVRSEDPYIKVGACALRHDKSVAGVGYNGAPPDIEIDWSDRDQRRKLVIHAEVNCLAYCSPGECSLIACTLLPCADCIKFIARYKIKKVFFREIYEKDRSALEVAPLFGIELIQLF